MIFSTQHITLFLSLLSKHQGWDSDLANLGNRPATNGFVAVLGNGIPSLLEQDDWGKPRA